MGNGQAQSAVENLESFSDTLQKVKAIVKITRLKKTFSPMLTAISELMGKTFQAAQLTHESFDHSTTHQRSVEAVSIVSDASAASNGGK